MESSITPARIANAIRQDEYDGVTVLVEGGTDIQLYRKFTRLDACKIKPTFGKYHMRKVVTILAEELVGSIIGIRDADFIRIKGNTKFDANYSDPIVITDYHDSESMIINSRALDDFVISDIKEEKFKKNFSSIDELRLTLKKLSYPLACLKLANKRFGLGLFFKPQNDKENHIKYAKFVDADNVNFLGYAKLAQYIIDYSKNKSTEIASYDIVMEKLFEIQAMKYNIDEMVNGHDMVNILYLIYSKKLKSKDSDVTSSVQLESKLRAYFCREYFFGTELFESLDKWQDRTENNIISKL
ncbi:TPA: hypothetical protein N2810_000560 [Vibrio parahaemolyticus]|nr:hypothetical protein [Vibrio parahaemolyticus]